MDLNGDGSIDPRQLVLESDIVPAAGGPRDVTGDGDQDEHIFEEMDQDSDDLPVWDDYDGDFTPSNRGVEWGADHAEPRDEDALSDQDWGNPGKQHDVDDEHDN